jgi:hypothetical protein
MSPDQTALVLFHREVLLPEVKRVVDEAVVPLRRRLDAIEKQMKRLDQRVGLVDLKLDALDSLWDVTKAIGDAVGAKVPWRKPAEASPEGVE